jgi:diguanylate cyclase (GGDEF)-like protein
MPNHGGWWRHPAWVPLLLGTCLLLTLYAPSPLWIGLLLIAVIRAARQWPGRIAWGVAVLSVVLLGSLLLRIRQAAMDPLLLPAFLWLGVALLTVAGTLGYATQQARSLAATNRELRAVQERLDALYQITLAVSTTLEPSGVLAAVLDRLGALGYDAMQIFLWQEEDGEMRLAAERGTPRLSPELILRGVADRTEPFVITQATGISAFIPLTNEGRILGLLYVERAEDDGFTESDLAMLGTAAKGASARLVNAQLYEKARVLAITDPITELYNYRYYQEKVSAHLREAQLSGAPFALLMIDLDYFKQCNDTYGHVTGDAVLRQVAKLLKDSCRETDLCFRYGGEEFTILLPEVDRELARSVAERIRARIQAEQFYTSSGRPIEMDMSVSIGVVTYPDDGLTAGDLILAADHAMYRAKAMGRNRVVAGGDAVSSAS